MAPAQLAVADGHTYVEGRNPDTARALLEAAAEAGLENAVKTTSFGYIVPDAVHEAYLAGPADEDETPKDDGQGEDPEGHKAVEFDPSEAKVEEVLEYMAGADEDERARVLAAEVAGKNRVTIIEGAK